MGSMRVLIVSGSRHGADATLIRRAVAGYDFVIHGCARGVDWQTRRACRAAGIRQVTVGAWWDEIGSGAGPERNQEMVDLAVSLRDMGASVEGAAFPGADSFGTYDCVRRMKAAGISCTVTKGTA